MSEEQSVLQEGKQFTDLIPEAYRESSWAKENAADPEAFFKFVDNQNTLVGKKGVIVPGDGATEAEIGEFYKTLGRPDTPDEYDMTPSEELKGVKRDAEIDAEFKNLFHSAGLSKTAAAKISQGFEKILYAKGKAEIDKTAAEDKAFDEFNTKLFADNKDTIVANAQKILKETIPKEALPALDKLDGEAMSALVAITNSLYAKYGKEDEFKGGGGEGGGTGETYEELSAQQRKLMENPGFLDFRHAEYEGLRTKNTELMDKMRLLKP